MSTATVTVHLGLVPVRPEGWTAEPLPELNAAGAPYPVDYYGTSFVSWGEPLEHGEPHEVTIDLEASDPKGAHTCLGCMTRGDYTEIADTARRIVDELVPDSWRLVDYVVVTDAADHSVGARTVGMWGA